MQTVLRIAVIRNALIFFLLCSVGKLSAQWNNFRLRTFTLNADTLVFDSLSIAEPTFRFENPADTLFCRVDFSRKALIRTRKDTIDRVIVFRYRVYPMDFKKKYFNKDIRQLQKDLSLPENPFNLIFSSGEKPKQESFSESDGLTKNGSEIGRAHV